MAEGIHRLSKKIAVSTTRVGVGAQVATRGPSPRRQSSAAATAASQDVSLPQWRERTGDPTHVAARCEARHKCDPPKTALDRRTESSALSVAHARLQGLRDPQGVAPSAGSTPARVDGTSAKRSARSRGPTERTPGGTSRGDDRLPLVSRYGLLGKPSPEGGPDGLGRGRQGFDVSARGDAQVAR